MKKLLLIAVSIVGLGACTYPQTTRMEPVGETQMQTAEQPAPPAGDAAKPKKTSS